MSKDPKLKVVLKEFPVLGPSSLEAAQVAVAVRMQDKSGKKYLEFHQKLLTGRGQIDKARAMAAAKEIGLDMARLEQDLKSDEIGKTLEESMKLAEALGPQRHAELCDQQRRGDRRRRRGCAQPENSGRAQAVARWPRRSTS